MIVFTFRIKVSTVVDQAKGTFTVGVKQKVILMIKIYIKQISIFLKRFCKINK